MSNSSRGGKRLTMEKHLQWIPVNQMRVSPQAQRDLNQAWVDHIAANLDPEHLGNPTVSHRSGHFWIIDGQHRVAAVREALGEDQTMQCWIYKDLTEEQEAEVFLKLNNTRSVDTFSKFRIGVKAGRDEECDIDRIVRAQDLRVSRESVDGAVRAVGTLRRVYRNGGPNGLARTLRIVRDAYGDAGMEAAVLDGIGMLTARFNGELRDPEAVERLSRAHGGVNGLLNRAELMRRQTGAPRNQCVAAAAIEIVNKGRRGKDKLPDWWSDGTSA